MVPFADLSGAVCEADEDSDDCERYVRWEREVRDDLADETDGDGDSLDL